MEEAKKTIHALASNYVSIEKSIVNQLKIYTPKHHVTTGTYREGIWKTLFEMIVPKKFCIEQGVFIIDSEGHISKEVDLVVFDEVYTPYIFKYAKIKFIPIEAVAIVIQCKSNIKGNKLLQDVQEWVKSIDDLHTSMNSMARMQIDLVDNGIRKEWDKHYQGKTQTATRPIKILCALEISTTLREDLQTDFDIILYVDVKKDRLVKIISDEEQDYALWYHVLNHSLTSDQVEEMVEEIGQNGKSAIAQEKDIKFVSDKGISLKKLKIAGQDGNENIILSLTFQLNQMLMFINNPMLFPHMAYAEWFNTILGEGMDSSNNGKGKQTDE